MCFKIQISQKTTFENSFFFFFSMKKFGLCNFSETRCPVPTKNTGHSGHFTGLYRTYRTLQDLQDFTGHTGFTGLWYAWIDLIDNRKCNKNFVSISIVS